MGDHNRWAREGGVIDELIVENTYRNKEGKPMLGHSIYFYSKDVGHPVRFTRVPECQ